MTISDYRAIRREVNNREMPKNIYGTGNSMTSHTHERYRNKASTDNAWRPIECPTCDANQCADAAKVPADEIHYRLWLPLFPPVS